MTSTEQPTTVVGWLRDNARVIDSTEFDGTGTELATLTDRLGGATVVGLGESTRASRQTFGVRHRILRALVEEHGFRALAIQDTVRSGTQLDHYVRTGEGNPAQLLADAWRPWRTAEMVGALDWIRGFNQLHPHDQVAIFGVNPTPASPADYDLVLDHVRHFAPHRLAELEAHLLPIRTAHQIDEHVQRHQGIHPGRPFVEHASDALALVEQLAPHEDSVRAAAARVLAFHRDSVAGRGSFAADERSAADIVIGQHRETGAKIAYWDGIGHTAASAARVGATKQTLFRGAGEYLRAEFGAAYVSVAIGFHHGDLGSAIAPPPAPDLLDATLGTVELPAYYVDLSSAATEAVSGWLRGSAKARTINGLYDPEADAEANMTVDSLADAFDVLVHIRETSPPRWLAAFAPG
ncbi:erythromycin esterase family protein [Nocardia callitridis]|uniref:Erythromycin esterase family protein n=1 Tax=Nocardia callitridis TaxID=648753 RepID=A0ABP9K1M3_9NOCA